jgi:flagellar biosynthesis/type III secretory pathway ATPase
MRTTNVLIAVAALALPFAATAQEKKATAKGGEVTVSEPGKAGMARTIEASAQVVSIDKKKRTLSLKAANGKVGDVVAGPEVKNFDQIKVGDMVVARVMQSLMLELQKVKSGMSGISATDTAIKAQPGERPAVGMSSEVSAIAKVTKVDPKAKIIALVGPRGNEVTLDVQNPKQFDVVKVGDEVLVTYTEAVAVSVEPAKKPEAKKADAKK